MSSFVLPPDEETDEQKKQAEAAASSTWSTSTIVIIFLFVLLVCGIGAYFLWVTLISPSPNTAMNISVDPVLARKQKALSNFAQYITEPGTQDRLEIV